MHLEVPFVGEALDISILVNTRLINIDVTANLTALQVSAMGLVLYPPKIELGYYNDSWFNSCNYVCLQAWRTAFQAALPLCLDQLSCNPKQKL